MKFEKTEVWGFKHAIRGMRNPMNSWNKSDSDFSIYIEDRNNIVVNNNIGKNDLNLAQRLIKAGSEHRKFMRQIFVSVDITAPLYWWKEFDTYKVGTVANSTSTMHKLASIPITKDCFEMGDYSDLTWFDKENYIDFDKNKLNCMSTVWSNLIYYLEQLRQNYKETKDKRYWKELIRLLPESWLQKRTITMNYENILNIIHQRKNHKLNEWSSVDNPSNENFIKWAKTLPYAEELLFL